MNLRFIGRMMQRLTEDQAKMERLQLPNRIPVDETYAQYTDNEDDCANSAFSIASTKYNFYCENGRFYQDYRSGHPFPHDEMSQENELVLHSMVLFLLEDKLIAAPTNPENFRNVLDIATGMGLWAEDIADRYPDCQVVGVDLAPHENSVRPNYKFLCFDVINEWVFDNPNLRFDFIHIRSLFASLAPHHWPQFYKQALQ